MRLLRILGLLSIILVVVFTPTSLVSADGNERWEYYNTNSDSQIEVYIPYYYAQTFTANYSHTVDYIKLKLQRENTSCGIMTVEITPTNASSYPDGDALTSGTYNGLLLSNSSSSWAMIELTPDISLSANTTYAIVVHSTGVNTTDNINWLLDQTAPTYSDGQYFNSSDGGFTFTNNSSKDFMFEVWGENVLEITDCRVYSSYWEKDDWLVVLSYKNFYEPYYPNYNPKDYFDLELWKSSTFVTQIPMQQWGYKPGAIYLSALEATIQEWGNTSYYVKMNSTFTNDAYTTCNLTTDKWKGNDLTDFDDWCMLLAGDMDDFYSPDDPFTIFSSTSGRALLSEEAGIYFNLGIPGLSQVIPEMFSVVMTLLNVSEGNWSTDLTEWGNFSAILGPEIVDSMDDFGVTWFTLPVGAGTKAIFWILNILVFGFMAGIGVPRGHHMAGLMLGLPILFGGAIIYTAMWIPLAVATFMVVVYGVIALVRNA